MLELHVYDFDGSLFRSPDSPSWWDGSWFISDASLGVPCVPDVPGSDWWIGSTVADAKKSIGNPDVLAIVLTGRSVAHGGYRYRVPELLKQAGLHFDRVMLNTGGDTPTFKAKTVTRLLRTFDFVTIHLWEDNVDNMRVIEAVALKEGVVFVPHFVHSTGHPITCTPNDIERSVAKRWMDPKVLKKIKREAGLLEAPPAMVKAITGWTVAVRAAEAIGDYTDKIGVEKWNIADIKKNMATIAIRGKLLKAVMLVDDTKKIERAFNNLGDFVENIYGLGVVVAPRRNHVIYVTEESKPRVLGEIDTWIDRTLGELEKMRQRRLATIAQYKKHIDILEPDTKPEITRGNWSKGFDVDLTGWRYDTPKLREALGTLSTWGEIQVKLSPSLPLGVGGSWQDSTKTLVIPLQIYDADVTQAAIRHELQHMTQSLMKAALRTKTFFGVPSHNIRTPNFDQSQNRDYLKLNTPKSDEPDALQVHDLDDREFYTELTDLIGGIKNWMKRERPDPVEQKRKILELMGVAGDVQNERREIRTWKRYAPGKWRKAIQEIYRAFPVLSNRSEPKVAFETGRCNPNAYSLAWMDPKVLKKIKHAGILEPPPAMVDGIKEWVQAVAAATRKEQLDDSFAAAKEWQRKAPERYASLFDAIKDLRALFDKGTSRTLFVAANHVWEEAFGRWGYGIWQPKNKDFQKLDAAGREVLIQRLGDWIQRIDERANGEVADTGHLERYNRDMAEIRSYLRPDVNPLKGDSIRRPFPVDLTGWKYDAKNLLSSIDKKELKKLQDIDDLDPSTIKPHMQPIVDRLRKRIEDIQNGDSEWRKIWVELTMKPEVQHAAGWWDGMNRSLSIVVPDQVYPHHIELSLIKTLEHELRHMAQTYLQAALSDVSHWLHWGTHDRLPVPGMPSRHIMTPTYHQEDKRKDTPFIRSLGWDNQPPSASQVHTLDDVEFHTVLADAIAQTHRLLKHDADNIRHYYKRDPTQKEIKTFLLETLGMIPSQPMLQERNQIAHILATWKKWAPGKWKRAVKEFYRAFPVLAQRHMAKRVATRFMQARVRTFDARWVDALEHDWERNIARMAKDVLSEDVPQRDREEFAERLTGWTEELQRDLAYHKGISLVYQANDDIRDVWSAMRGTFGRIKTIAYYAKGDRPDIFRQDVREMLDDAPIVFKALRKMVERSDDIPVEVVPDSVVVGRIRIIARGEMDRAFNPEDYVPAIKKAVSILTSKGFGKLCYGMVFCGPDPNQGTWADYNLLKDTISCYLPPKDPKIVRSLLHEFGHRWYFRFMDRSRQGQFDRFFKKVNPTTAYGGSADFEDFAEVFADWVMEASGLHREQIERLRAVLDTDQPFEQSTAIVPMVRNTWAGKRASGREQVTALVEALEARFPGLRLDLYPTGKDGWGNQIMELSAIVVPKGQREQGIGTKVMREIVEAADAHGWTLALTPSSDFGGSKSRLVSFYRGFGFVPNHGRSKDYTTRATMMRSAPMAKRVASRWLDRKR